jgi:hypothetical protein
VTILYGSIFYVLSRVNNVILSSRDFLDDLHIYKLDAKKHNTYI